MADKQRVDLPADFDALLRWTVAVEPSPEFLARVREQVAEERRPSRWMAPLTLAGVAAAATLAVAIVLTMLPGVSVVSPHPPAAPALRGASAERPRPELPTIQRETVRGARVTAVRRPARNEGESLPIVIVDQRQRAALNTFVRMAQQGSLAEETFAQTMPTSTQPIEEHVLPIAVEPLAVSPIPVGGVLPSGIERN